VHSAILAFAHVLRRIPDAQFTIVGSGPEEDRLRTMAGTHHLGDKVRFISWLPQQELFDLYSSHDLFVFPSVHDSGGMVVIEAMSHGLPVICLDLGGPQYAVTRESGIVIKSGGLNTEQVAVAMADEISKLAVAPDRLSILSEGAIARANQSVLAERVAQFYNYVSDIAGLLDRDSRQRKQRYGHRDGVLRTAASAKPWGS
jgi:glycosyltransferase involved in cell wall biosynthesis